jgi:hypothetical protein
VAVFVPDCELDDAAAIAAWAFVITQYEYGQRTLAATRNPRFKFTAQSELQMEGLQPVPIDTKITRPTTCQLQLQYRRRCNFGIARSQRWNVHNKTVLARAAFGFSWYAYMAVLYKIAHRSIGDKINTVDSQTADSCSSTRRKQLLANIT